MILLSYKQQIKAFAAVALPLALSKFFQETLYVMSYFMEQDIGVHASRIYDCAKYQPLGVAIGYIATAFFVDKIGIRKMLTMSMIGLGASLLAFSFNSAFELLTFYRLCIGICIGCIYNCSFGALPIIFDHHQLPSKTSLLYVFAFSSAMAAPQIMSFGEPYFSWRTLVAFMALICFFGSLASFKFFPQKTGLLTSKEYMNQINKLLKNKIFLLMAVVSTLCMGGFYGFVAIFINNLQALGITSQTAKFIVTDMQFIGRIMLFSVTTIASVKLTQKAIPGVLKLALCIMSISSIGLICALNGTGSLFGNNQLLGELVALAQNNRHVFAPLLTCISGAWLFWIYTALIGVAQPANKSKALSIAGKQMSGSAQAILGFCLSIGEFVFASIAAYSWPFGTYTFLGFVILAALVVMVNVHVKRNCME